MSFGFLALGLFGGVLAFLLIQFLGRRAIYRESYLPSARPLPKYLLRSVISQHLSDPSPVLGLVLLTTLQLFVGILDVLPTYAPHSPLVWAQSILLLLWNFVYDLTIGPVCFILISEISAVRLRAKTIAVATAIQAVLGIFMTVAIPYLINPDEGNMRGKLGFFFGGLAGLSLVWTWFKVPETKDRTFEELDVMFERRVPTREFGNYLTD